MSKQPQYEEGIEELMKKQFPVTPPIVKKKVEKSTTEPSTVEKRK